MQHGEVSTGQVLRSKRGRQTAMDMVRSLGLMAIVIGALLMITPARKLIFAGNNGSAGTPITDTQQLTEWRQLTGHPAMLPPVPAGWRINAATMSGSTVAKAHLHVGWVTPQQQYVGVDEGYLPARRLLAAAIGGGSRAAGTVGIGGRQWAVRSDRRGDVAYVLRQGKLGVVVAGSVGRTELQHLAGQLRPATGSTA